jgi:hypothetical protein
VAFGSKPELDAALLWNRRAAHGDFSSLPIGIPLDELDTRSIQTMLEHAGRAQFGFARHEIYVTSASISIDDLKARLGDTTNHPWAICEPHTVAQFGPAAAFFRSEVAVWNDGEATVPMPTSGDEMKLIRERLSNPIGIVHLDISVPSDPFPAPLDARFSMGGRSIYAGALTRWASGQSIEQVTDIYWPSSLARLQAVASRRGLLAKESLPGRTARHALSSLNSVFDVGLLAHAPLLELLSEMAASRGYSYYKRKLSERNIDVDDSERVARSVQGLKSVSFSRVKKALHNDTKSAENWLQWAELADVVVKGVETQCSECKARQWSALTSLRVPSTCDGCRHVSLQPFGARTHLDFSYRLSERFRALYEYDAIGHLLLIRYLAGVFGVGRSDAVIGFHPGIEFLDRDTKQCVGEADVVMLTARGHVIPFEVKTSTNGLTVSELAKLAGLAKVLQAPWRGLAVCEYQDFADASLESFEQLNEAGTRSQIALGLDRLLDPHPSWRLGSDPFSTKPLTEAEIRKREESFRAPSPEESARWRHEWRERDLLG